MELFKIDTLPDKGLVEDDSSDHEEDSVSEKTEKIVKEQRDVEALEKFLFGSSHSDPNLLPEKLDDSLEPSNKKVKKEAWVDEDDLVPAEHGFVNAKKYPKKVTKEASYRSHLVDKFESIYGRPKWATKALNKNKDDSDDEDLDLLGTAGDILSKGKRLHKNNIEYSKCANLTASESLKGIVTSVQFHPYSNVALISSINGQTNLVQVDGDENRKLNSIVLENYNLNRARFTVDGEEIIMGSKAASGFFFSYDMHSGVSVKVPLIRGSQRFPLKDFFLSPDGKYLASCGNKGNFYLFTMNPKENVASFKLNYDVLGICFSPDSSKLFASDEGAVYVYDIRRSRRCLHRFIDDGALKCRYLAVSPNSKYLATGDESGLLNVYNYEEVITNNAPKPLKSFSNLVHPITSLKFNHTSEMLAAASSYTDNAIKIAHFPSCTVFSNFPQANALFNRINEVDISPNSGYIAMANNKGKAYLYRLNHYADY